MAPMRGTVPDKRCFQDYSQGCSFSFHYQGSRRDGRDGVVGNDVDEEIRFGVECAANQPHHKKLAGTSVPHNLTETEMRVPIERIVKFKTKMNLHFWQPNTWNCSGDAKHEILVCPEPLLETSTSRNAQSYLSFF